MVTTTGLHVVCPTHGARRERLAWIVCQHVVDARVPISHLRYPEKDALGELLCFECYTTYRRVDDALRLECPECVDEILRARESNA